MKKIKHDSEPPTTRPPDGEAPDVPPTRHERTHEHTHEQNGEKTPEAGALAEDLYKEATRWVRANQTAALLGAFGVGVFIGVLLRK